MRHRREADAPAPDSRPRRAARRRTSGIRTPSRLFTLTSLGLALLAAAGLCLVVRTLSELPSLRVAGRGSIAATLAGCVLVGAILLEGFGPVPHFPVPSPPPEMKSAPAPQLHLPSDYGHDLIYTYWSTNGFRDMVNGSGSFELNELLALRTQIAGFPDAPSVDALRELGVRTVVLHSGFAAGTLWADAARRPIAGLPLRREIRPEVILYHLEPKRQSS